MVEQPAILYVALGVKDNHIIVCGVFRDEVRAFEVLHHIDLDRYVTIQVLEGVEMRVSAFIDPIGSILD